MWEAIPQWVEAYLGLFYGSDNAVTSDTEIQNWAAELVAFDGARLQDFGDRGDGQIATLAYHMGFHSVGDRSAGRICPGKDVALDMLVDILVTVGKVRRACC